MRLLARRPGRATAARCGIAPRPAGASPPRPGACWLYACSSARHSARRGRAFWRRAALSVFSARASSRRMCWRARRRPAAGSRRRRSSAIEAAGGQRQQQRDGPTPAIHARAPCRARAPPKLPVGHGGHAGFSSDQAHVGPRAAGRAGPWRRCWHGPCRRGRSSVHPARQFANAVVAGAASACRASMRLR